jgi:hypothetical protein
MDFDKFRHEIILSFTHIGFVHAKTVKLRAPELTTSDAEIKGMDVRQNALAKKDAMLTDAISGESKKYIDHSRAISD